MNKKLVALAVAGAVLLPAVAQAQTTGVTLYGRVHVLWENFKVDTIGRGNRIDNVSSRFGLRATESVGGGLSAFAHWEAGITVDQPGTIISTANVTSSTVVTREGWVGLQGGFGTVKFGSGLTPFDDVLGYTHLFWATGLENQTTTGGGVRNITNSGGPGGFNFTGYLTNISLSTDIDARYPNSIYYASPVIAGGLQFKTHYSFISETNTGRKAKGWDSAVEYKNGPLYVGLAYAKHMDFTGPAVTGGTGNVNHDADAWRLSGGYKIGPADIRGAWEQIKYKADNGLSGSAKTRYFNIGAIIDAGPGMVVVQYHNRNKGIAGTVNAAGVVTGIVDVDNGGQKHYTLGYRYPLSKRTEAYTYVTQVKPEVGNKVTAIALALNHLF